jgi:hypothetical protein
VDFDFAFCVCPSTAFGLPDLNLRVPLGYRPSRPDHRHPVPFPDQLVRLPVRINTVAQLFHGERSVRFVSKKRVVGHESAAMSMR